MHMDFSLLTLHFRQAFFTFNFFIFNCASLLALSACSSLLTLHLNMLLANLLAITPLTTLTPNDMCHFDAQPYNAKEVMPLPRQE